MPIEIAARCSITGRRCCIVCFVGAGLITRFLNQPINAMVITWQTDAPQANWMGLRDEWWRWHRLRLLAGLGGLSLLIAAMLQRG